MTEADSGPTAGPDVFVEETDVGRGLFARRAFEGGERILRLQGKAIDFAGTLAKGDRECDALQIGDDLYLDLEEPARFVNHSCEPNACVRDGAELAALCDIAAGEEIRFDYSTTLDEDHWTMECRCGSPRCRGKIRDFRWLPREWKLELIRRGAVPSFIVASELDEGRLTPREIRSAPRRRRGGCGATAV
jgi:hypothetical protein